MRIKDIEVVHGIKYEKPTVILLQETGIGVAEIAARTCYDSFDSSENHIINECDNMIKEGLDNNQYKEHYKELVNNIEDSALLDDLSWTFFHHSILEHTNVSFIVRGTSRGALQEQARHRIQAISVRSTRYTMSGIINAFIASLYAKVYDKGTTAKDSFIEIITKFDMFVTNDKDYNKLQIEHMFDLLIFQRITIGEDDFTKLAIAKSSLHILKNTKGKSTKDIFKLLQKGKKKRNVGDAFKHIINDNVKVDMVITFNLRSLKNYFNLRDSGAAYFQIRWIAEEMKNVLPRKYLKLIDKKVKAEEE